MWQRASQGGGSGGFAMTGVVEGTPTTGNNHTISVPSGVTEGILVSYAYTGSGTISSITGATIEYVGSIGSTAGGYSTKNFYNCKITASTISVTLAAGGTLEKNVSLLY